MKARLIIIALLATLVLSVPGASSAIVARDDFGEAVKLIEQFYHVKHQSLPLLAKATMKAATTAARIKGGEYRKLAEAGSVKVVFFENQEFNSRGDMTRFRASLVNAVGNTWSPLIQTLSATEESQTYIFLRQASEKFNVLVVTIERHEAVVVQVNLKPATLAMLLKDPNEMGKAITDDATTNDN